jgi:pimeloyl-ACP methyl ester carboxylesterase
VRVIAFDRPGYGRSDPQPGRRVADVAADVASLADALGLERFGVFGYSGGGPHALACAALLPDRVTRTAVHVGVAPADDPAFDFFAGMAELNVQDFERARADPDAYREHIAPQIVQVKADPLGFLDELLTQMPDADRRAFETPGVRELLAAQWREAMLQDEEGVLEDDLAFVADWGFDLGPLPAPTLLVQGGHDLMVPPAHFRWLADHVSNGEVRFEPDEGHLTLYEHAVPAVHEWLLRFF